MLRETDKGSKYDIRKGVMFVAACHCDGCGNTEELPLAEHIPGTFEAEQYFFPPRADGFKPGHPKSIMVKTDGRYNARATNTATDHHLNQCN